MLVSEETKSMLKWIAIPLTGFVFSLSELVLLLLSQFNIFGFLLSSNFLIISIVYLWYKHREFTRFQEHKKRTETPTIISQLTVEDLEVDDEINQPRKPY